MPPRLTLREIQARRQRAEKGIACFKSLMMQFSAEKDARTQGGPADVVRAIGDASWERRVEELQREMAAAIEMIREGMPRNTIQVNDE